MIHGDPNIYLVAVYMGSPLSRNRTLQGSVVSLSSDIDQHFVHATTFTDAKPLQDCQHAFTSLPAIAHKRLLFLTRGLGARDVVCSSLMGDRQGEKLPVRCKVFTTDKH